MSSCKISWKSENYVLLEGEMDGDSLFCHIFQRALPAVWVDFGGIRRVNSQGVRSWVKALEQAHTRLHFVNLPVCVMEQFALVSEFRGKCSDVSSFWAQYTCHSCRRDESVLLVVGRDIEPGHSTYEDGPERNCSDCGRAMEFAHDPNLILAFMKQMGVPQTYPGT
jgi:hypothetical protein